MSSLSENIFLVTETPPHIHIDSIRFIREVKKHPVIFNVDLPGRSSLVIFSAWESIIEPLVPSFRFLDESDKVIIRRNVRKRWSAMRSKLTQVTVAKSPSNYNSIEWLEEMKFLVPLVVKRRQDRLNMKCHMVQRAQSNVADVVLPATSPASSSSQLVPSPTPSQSNVVLPATSLLVPSPTPSQSNVANVVLPATSAASSSSAFTSYSQLVPSPTPSQCNVVLPATSAASSSSQLVPSPTPSQSNVANVVLPATSAASSSSAFTSYSQLVPSPTPSINSRNIIQMFIEAFTPERYQVEADEDKNFVFGVLEVMRRIRPEQNQQKEKLRQQIRSFFV